MSSLGPVRQDMSRKFMVSGLTCQGSKITSSFYPLTLFISTSLSHGFLKHQEDHPDLWDAASTHSIVLPQPILTIPESTNGVEIFQILKWWLSLLICLLAMMVFLGFFWLNQMQCNHIALVRYESKHELNSTKLY